MTIVFIAALVTTGIVSAYITLRRRAVSVELGSMSNQWVAEQRSSEHTYNDR